MKEQKPEKKKPTAQRSMWRGSVSFGLVNIPVRLVPAVRSKDVRFHLLHKKDNSRLERKMVCPIDHEEVSEEAMVKGYEIAPGQHVIVQKEELDALAPKASRTIEVQYFVGEEDIDPVFYSRPYYLVPEESSFKSYSLFVEAMRRAKKVGVATFVMHNKEYLASIRGADGVLCLQTMYFEDEVVHANQVGGASRAKTGERELKTALQLIESLSDSFRPEKIKDEYREAVLDLVEKKAEGREIALQPAAEEETPKVKDLLAALEASLAEARKRKDRTAVHLEHNGGVLSRS